MSSMTSIGGHWQLKSTSSCPPPRLTCVLERAALFRAYREKLRADNGPEFISLALTDWAEEYNVTLDLIQPGKPTQSSHTERFN